MNMYSLKRGDKTMTINEKMVGSKRRKLIISQLRNSNKPITGTEFAEATNVSRQVIVQDISILKAKEEPILATSRGYILQSENKESKIIVVNHTPGQTKEELNIIVDHGVTVKDVTVEHALYGEITASIMVSNRAEVNQFIHKMNETKAPYLLTLTNGIHLHTLEADSLDKIEAACKDLAANNLLL